MPAYYSIIQCVPDPIADERINVGVIVFGEGQVQTRFLQNWDRVARFTQGDIGYVREFADWLEQAALQSAAGPVTAPLPGFPPPGRLDEESIRRMAAEWSNSIQFTAPQASLEPPDDLLANMAELFLREPKVRSPRFRDRQDVARTAVRAVRHAVEQRLDATMAQQVVRAAYPIGGKVVRRLRLDLAVTNGRVYVASRALSFETFDMPELDRQIRDAVYTLRDVRDFLGDVRIDMIALPPNTELRNYRQAEQRFREALQACERIDARVVLEQQAPDWAAGIADLVETQIGRRETRALKG